TITAGAFQVHGGRHASALMAGPQARRGVAGLVGTPENTEALATKRKHLGHERQSVEPSIFVEGPQNLFLARNFDDFPSSQASVFAQRSPLPDLPRVRTHAALTGGHD